MSYYSLAENLNVTIRTDHKYYTATSKYLEDGEMYLVATSYQDCQSRMKLRCVKIDTTILDIQGSGTWV